MTGSAIVQIRKANLAPELELVNRHDASQSLNVWTYRTPHGIPKLTVYRENSVALSGMLGRIATLFSGKGDIVTDYGVAEYRCREDGSDYRIYSDSEVETLPVGAYTLRVDIPESRNYNAAFAEASFRVTKAPHEDVTVGPISVAAGARNLTGNLSAYLVDEASCALAGSSGNLVAPDSVALTESGNAVRFDTAAPSGNAQGAVKVTVSSRNYLDYTITVNLTAGEAFTLRFDSAGGSEITETRTLRAGELVGTLPETVRAGYAFGGWYETETPFTAQSAMPGKDTTLSARWTPNVYTVTLRYLYGGMSRTYEEWAAVEGSYNETYEAYETWTRSFRTDSESFALPEPIRNGYVFLGWQDADGKTLLSVTVPQGTAQNLVYDAIWKLGDRRGEVSFASEDAESNIRGFMGMTETGRDASTFMRAIAAADETVVGANQTKNVKAELAGATLPNLTGRNESDLSAAERELRREQEAIYEAVKGVYPNDDTIKTDYIDIQVKKTVTALENDNAKHTETSLHETPIVEIPLRYDLTGRYNPQIARYHDGKPLLFHRLEERPENCEGLDGYCYVSEWGSNAVIYIYSSYFSTFSVTTSAKENFRVNFETDGGTWINDQILPRTGSQRAAQPETVTKSGYDFDGWYTLTADGTEEDFDFNTVITADTTLYARWKTGSTPAPTPTPTPTPAPTPSYSGSVSGGSGGGGGGSAPRTYRITVTPPENGTVTTSLTRASSGTRITVTATPEKDYSTEGVKVQTSAGKDVTVTKNADGAFEFIQPASDVVVTGTFAKNIPDNSDTPVDSPSDAPVDEPSGNSNSTDGGAPDTEHPLSPDETGVSDWLVTDSHPVYIRGFSDGTFRPYGNVTRAQVAMMFYRLLRNQNVSGSASFSDMTGNEWYAEAVYTLSKLGIVQGYKDGSFHGNDSISRAAFTAIAVRFLTANGQTLTPSAQFSDVPETHWAHDAIARAASCGWIGGYEDGTFRPAASITRAAVTAIINRMLNRSADEDYVEAHFAELQSFSDTPDHSAWYFYNMMEASNEHAFSHDDGQERWN